MAIYIENPPDQGNLQRIQDYENVVRNTLGENITITGKSLPTILSFADYQKIPAADTVTSLSVYDTLQPAIDTLQIPTIAQIKDEAIKLMSDAKMRRKKFADYRQQPDKPLPPFDDPTYNEAKMQQTRRFQDLIALSTALDTSYLDWVASLGDLRRAAEKYKTDPTGKTKAAYLVAYTVYLTNMIKLNDALQTIQEIIESDE